MEATSQNNQPVKLFYSYAHQDKRLRDDLARHISLLKQQSLIAEWHDRDIKPGQEWKKEINKNLQEADIILLLVTANFIESKYCDSPEVDLALQRHKEQKAWVIPILLRSTDWETSPIGELQALPYNLKPIDLWSNRPSAFAQVAKDIRSVVTELYATKNKNTVQDETAHTDPVISKPIKRKKRDLYKTIAKTNDFTIGDRIQHTLRRIGRYFSFAAANRRSKKRFSLLLLFLFGVLDLMALPFVVYQWTANLLATFGASILTLLLFTMGTLSKNNIVSVAITFVYCVVWTVIGYWYIEITYHLHLIFFNTLFISFLLSCLQLALFYTPSRSKKRIRFFPNDTGF